MMCGRLAWHSPGRLPPRPGAGEQLPGRVVSLPGEFSYRSTPWRKRSGTARSYALMYIGPMRTPAGKGGKLKAPAALTGPSASQPSRRVPPAHRPMSLAGQASGEVLHPLEFRRAVMLGIQSPQRVGQNLAAGCRMHDSEAVEARLGSGRKADQQGEFAAPVGRGVTLVACDEEGILHAPRAEGLALMQRFEECAHLGCRRLCHLDMGRCHGHPARTALDAVDDEYRAA